MIINRTSAQSPGAGGNDASLARLGGQRRADEGVRLDRDVDDVLAVAKSLQNVGDRRRRRPGALDDDIDS